MTSIVDYKLDINRFFELFVEMDKKYPRRHVRNPGEYGWEAVGRWERIELDYTLKRNRDIAKIVIDLMVAEKKLEIFTKDDKELVKEEDKIEYQGKISEWKLNCFYIEGDIVKNSYGLEYICFVPHISKPKNEPGVGLWWNSWWNLWRKE